MSYHSCLAKIIVFSSTNCRLNAYNCLSPPDKDKATFNFCKLLGVFCKIETAVHLCLIVHCSQDEESGGRSVTWTMSGVERRRLPNWYQLGHLVPITVQGRYWPTKTKVRVKAGQAGFSLEVKQHVGRYSSGLVSATEVHTHSVFSITSHKSGRWHHRYCGNNDDIIVIVAKSMTSSLVWQ